jgi:hypothetical protein
MAFKNEYIPPIEQETSEFAKQARKTFNKGHSKFDRWTIDRERQIALIHIGSGRKDPGDSNAELWELVDEDGYFVFSMDRIAYVKMNSDHVSITYKLLGFWAGERYSKPSEKTFHRIKEALVEHGKSYMFEMYAYKSCDLKFINSMKGEVA